MASTDGTSRIDTPLGRRMLLPAAWLSHLPLAMGTSAVVFLVGGAWVGARLSLRRAAADPEARDLSKLEKPHATLSSALKSAGPPLASLAARAFLYGTALCFCGAGVAVGAAAWILDVRSPQEFTDRLSSHGPRVRSSIQDVARPALAVVEKGGRVAARVTNDTVGAAVRNNTPVLRSGGAAGGRDDDFDGLSPRDAAALAEFTAWFNGEASGSGSASGTSSPVVDIPHHVPRGLRRGVRVE